MKIDVFPGDHLLVRSIYPSETDEYIAHVKRLIGRFHTEDALTAWLNLGKHFAVRTSTRRIICPNELPFVGRRSRRRKVCPDA